MLSIFKQNNFKDAKRFYSEGQINVTSAFIFFLNFRIREFVKFKNHYFIQKKNFTNVARGDPMDRVCNSGSEGHVFDTDAR